jgi:4-amino-4-deoxy-L-arabinose transferase-like glycosyltransferase
MSKYNRGASFWRIVVYWMALGLLLLAFLFRWQHLLARIFHIDEFISMLAIQVTAQRGAPIMPSGVFYSHGLLHSYIAAPFAWLSDRLSEEMLRWASLLTGMVTVALYYAAARRLFNSLPAGLAALTLAAVDNAMVVWSARARMYALAGMYVLLLMWLLLSATRQRSPSAWPVAAALCFAAAVAAHAVSVLLLPPLLLSLAAVLWLRREQLGWEPFSRPLSRRQVALIGGWVLLALAFGVAGQIPFLSPPSAVAADGGGGTGVLRVLNKFIEPGVSWQRVDDYIYHYTDAGAWPLTVLAGLALVLAVSATSRRRLTRHDLATLFLGLVFLLTLAELSLMLPSTWRKSRYLFILCQAPFLLLAADGIGRVVAFVLGALRRRSYAWSAVLGLMVVALLIFWQRGAFRSFLGAHGVGGYDTAFQWLADQRQSEDRVMTVHPSAAYLYLGQGDYYAAQSQARVVTAEESEELLDRYVGFQLVGTVAQLNQILTQERQHLWFVVDNVRLFKRYDPYFSQQVLAQMELAHETGGVSVFRGRSFPRPVPEQPDHPLAADFDGKVRLEGYSFDPASPAPDGSVPLVLFWRLQTRLIDPAAKVFVQLRDQENQTVAQADHFIWSGLLIQAAVEGMDVWDTWIRDSAYLMIPADLPAGRYRLLVGLYDPVTFERVPVLGDQSGENAVVLEEYVLQ